MARLYVEASRLKHYVGVPYVAWLRVRMSEGDFHDKALRGKDYDMKLIFCHSRGKALRDEAVPTHQEKEQQHTRTMLEINPPPLIKLCRVGLVLV